MTAEEFLQSEGQRSSSKLEPFLEDVRKLRAAGLSFSRIAEFLRINGVSITPAGLSDYFRRHGLETPQSSDEQPAPKRTPKQTKNTTPKPKEPVPLQTPVRAKSAPGGPSIFKTLNPKNRPQASSEEDEFMS